MEACWEYFDCDKRSCAMYGRSDVRCWEVEETLCNNPAIRLRRDQYSGKEEACAHSGCIYYEAVRIYRLTEVATRPPD